MGLLHTFIGREKFTWSSFCISYLYLSSMEGDVWRLQTLHTWAYFTLSLVERSSREVHYVYPTCISVQWKVTFEGYKHSTHGHTSHFHWKREVHVKFIQYILPVSLFNGRWRLKATNTPHMGILHTFIGREKFTWSSFCISYLYLSSMEGDVWRLQTLHTWAYFTVSLVERSSREVHYVYPTCISLQWKVTFEGYKHSTHGHTSHFHWKREVHVKFIQYILPVSLFNGRRRLKATNTPHMGLLHTFIGREKFTWSSCYISYLYLSSMEGDVWRLQTLHTWAYFTLSLVERSSREVHYVYPTCISVQWKVTFEGYKHSTHGLTSHFHWKREVHVKFILYILPVSLFNGRWRLKATNTPHMGILHTFIGREKFTWSSFCISYLYLCSMEGDVWRLQTLHTWAYFTLSLEERSSREVHSVYPICISVQWKVTFEGYKHSTHGHTSHFHWKREVHVKYILYILPVSLFNGRWRLKATNTPHMGILHTFIGREKFTWSSFCISYLYLCSMECDVWRLQTLHTWAYFTLSLEERSSREVHSVYPTCISLQWNVTCEGYKHSTHGHTSHFHWKREVHVKFILYILPVSLFNGRWRLKATNTPHMGILHSFIGREKFTWSSFCISYLYLSSMECDVWRLQALHTWAYFTLSLEERSSREVHSVYPTCISLQWNVTFEGYKHSTHGHTSHFHWKREVHVKFILYILPVSLFNGMWRVKATNTPHMGILHTFIGREKFTWSSFCISYLYLSSMEGDVWRLQALHTWAYFTLYLEERSSREVHSVYPTCISLQWKVTFEGYKHSTHGHTSHFHWKREVHVKFILYILPVSLFNGRWRLKATNTPHMGILHTFIGREKFTWSSFCISYLYLCSMECDVWRLQTLHTWAYFTLSLEERSSREVHSVYPTCISLQWNVTCEGYKHSTHGHTSHFHWKREVHVKFILYILPVSLFNGMWRLKATNTPHMGLLHTFIGREKFSWSSLCISYLYLCSMEGDVWRLQTLHTWAYFTLSLEERSSREVHSVYPTCISLQWKVTFEGYKHSTHGLTSHFHW